MASGLSEGLASVSASPEQRDRTAMVGLAGTVILALAVSISALTGASPTARAPAPFADLLVILAIAWAARQSIIVAAYSAIAAVHFCVAPILLAASGQQEDTNPPWIVVVWIVAIAAGSSLGTSLLPLRQGRKSVGVSPSLAERVLASCVVLVQIYLVSTGRLGYGAQLATGFSTPTGFLGDISVAAPCSVLFLLLRLLASGRRYDTWTYLLVAVEAVTLTATGFRGSGINLAISVAVIVLIYFSSKINRIGVFRGLAVAAIATMAVVAIFNAAASVKHKAAVTAAVNSSGTDLWSTGTLMKDLGTRLNLVDPLEAGVAYAQTHGAGDLDWGTQTKTVLPRALFPDKPNNTWGQQVTTEVFGEAVKSNSTISTLGDIFLNSGYGGVIVIALLVGYGGRRLERRLRAGGMSTAVCAVGAVILSTITNHEIPLGLIFVTNLQSFLIIWAVFSLAQGVTEVGRGTSKKPSRT